jgi:hypothetical protein
MRGAGHDNVVMTRKNLRASDIHSFARRDSVRACTVREFTYEASPKRAIFRVLLAQCAMHTGRARDAPALVWTGLVLPFRVSFVLSRYRLLTAVCYLLIVYCLLAIC